MNLLNVAIIGAGNIAGGYDENRIGDDGGVYTHAGAYRASGKFRLETIFDANAARAEDFRRHWGGERLASTLEEIASSYHDVISVCTPDHTHFDIVKRLLESGCCKAILVEKPLAPERSQVAMLEELAAATGIHLVVNFQRRWDPVHREIGARISKQPENLLSVGGCYIKGLRHIGVTLVDTLTFLCGSPLAARALARVHNRQANDDTYEFMLRYPNFNALVRTVDVARFEYSYHIFELDMLFTDRRLTLLDNSQAVREAPLSDYAYSGVKVLNERNARCRETGYKTSMLDAVEYLYRIATGAEQHAINTPRDSWNDMLIVERIIESFGRGCTELLFEDESWKK